MKSILATVQIQFDQFTDGNSEQYTMETIGKINEVLQREFNDISPSIFGNNIDSSDIEVSEEEEEEEEEKKMLLETIKLGNHKQFFLNKETNKVSCRCGHSASWWKTGYICGTITARPCKYS